MDTIFYLFNVNLHFIAMQTSGANTITLHIVQKEQCTPNVFSATHSTLLVVPLPLEDILHVHACNRSLPVHMYCISQYIHVLAVHVLQ